MAETVLINAATVAAGESSAVMAHQMLVPAVQFRVVCSKAYTVRFWVADSGFADVANAAELAGTSDSASATHGTVYSVDPGAYDYVACVVTNDDVADDATVTIAAGYDLVAEAPTALFTVAEARTFDKAQLASGTGYTDAVIIAKEAEVREWLAKACGVDLIPTSHTDALNGDGSPTLLLERPKITAVTAASINGVALTADELDPDNYTAGLAFEETGLITRRAGVWTRGVQNVSVTYTAGLAAVPALIKRAALFLAVAELPASNAPWQADSYEAGGTSYSWTRGDGFNGNWSPIPDVQKAIRMYDGTGPGVA